MKYFTILVTSIMVASFVPFVANAKDILVNGAFDCESTQVLRVDPFQEQYEKERKQTFTVFIDEYRIRFLSPDGSYLNGTNQKIRYHQDHLLSANGEFSAFSMERTLNRERFRFHYVDAMFSRSFVVLGYCKGY